MEEGRHLIRTGDSPPETEDPTDMAGSRIRQVQLLQEIAGTVGTHMGEPTRTELNGVKNLRPQQIERTN